MRPEINLPTILAAVYNPLRETLVKVASFRGNQDAATTFSGELVTEDVRESGKEVDLRDTNPSVQEYLEAQSVTYTGVFEALDPVMSDLDTVLILFKERPDLFEDLEKKLEPDVISGLKLLFKVATCDPTVLPDDSSSNAYGVWRRLSRDRQTFVRLVDCFTRLEHKRKS